MSFGIGLLKPDCIKRGLEMKVYDMMISVGLKIVFKKRMQLDPQKLHGLYGKWNYKEFYPDLCKYMMSGEVEVFIVEGDNAIFTLQSVVGEKNGSCYPKHTIRGRFATSQRENIVHSTNDQQTFIEEVSLLLDTEARHWLG